MIISKHLTSTIPFKRRTANIDKYGQTTYEDVGMIKCAIQDSQKVVQNGEKEYITITTTVFTDTFVRAKDFLGGREVETVFVMRDSRGRIQGYEATLK